MMASGGTTITSYSKGWLIFEEGRGYDCIYVNVARDLACWPIIGDKLDQ